jgi:iron complex transport system ATP-binding protein
VLCVREGRAVHWGTPEEIFTREIICGLYDLPPDSYEPSLGSFELSADTQQPRVFVIGGGGLGIPVYRKLRRQGIPFAAGVLQENDLDCPVARSLSSALVTEQAFEPVGERALNRAAALLEGCEALICCPERFGTQNRGNERLLEAARGRMPCLSAKEYLFEDKSV